MEESAWGGSYKISMRNLRLASVPYAISDEKENEVVSALFPPGEILDPKEEEAGNRKEDLPLFIRGELEDAVRKMKMGKTLEVVRGAVDVQKSFCTSTISGRVSFHNSGCFPN